MPVNYFDEVINGLRYTGYNLFGKKHGEVKVYLLNNNLFESCSYINGQKHGKCKEYNWKYGIINITMYINGQKHGKHKYYTFSKRLIGFKTYSRDVIHGECKFYYKNGDLKHYAIFVNGKCDYVTDYYSNRSIRVLYRRIKNRLLKRTDNMYKKKAIRKYQMPKPKLTSGIYTVIKNDGK